MLERITNLVITFFNCGKVKKAPGTFASFVALCIGFVLIYLNITRYNYLILTIVSTVLGVIFINFHIKFNPKQDNPDASFIVIDEIAGMFLIFFLSLELLHYYNASNNIKYIVFFFDFVFFRIFDIFKPFPINLFDKIKNAAGIMLDDIAAAIAGYACIAILTHIVLKV